VDGREIPLDEEGYLRQWQDWTPAVAEFMARADDFELDPERWEVVNLLREYYSKYEISPPMRALLKLLRLQPDATAWDSRRLYRLFPQGPAKQACRYAGLPRPVSCI
jgi:tRNA 2-thiouridine synthesizing protein E